MCELCTKIENLERRVALSEEKSREHDDLLLKLSLSGLQEVYSVKEAAVLLKKNKQTISEYCRTGKIKATKSDGKEGVYMITPEAIKNFINQKSAA